MSEERRTQTTKIGGGADYAKVADRLKLFREDHVRAKTESAYEIDVDGTVVFTVWLWKDKNDLLELMKSGVTDKEVLRSSADANGTAKSDQKLTADNRPVKEKQFEKLESVALGRALAMLGYLASGEIASVEEMEEFERFRAEQRQNELRAAIESLETAPTMDELKKRFVATKMMEVPEIVAAKDKRKSELSKTESTPAPKATAGAKTPPQKPATPMDTPTADPSLPLDEGQPSES